MSNKEIGYPFTAYPNYSIDKIMPVIDGNTFKVLTVIVRKTIGFHKKHDKIALSQFEDLTGLSRNTIIRSFVTIKSLKKMTRELLTNIG